MNFSAAFDAFYPSSLLDQLLLALSYALWSLMRQKKLLHYYQQHEYNSARFLKWLYFEQRRFDRFLSARLLLGAAVLFVLLLQLPSPNLLRFSLPLGMQLSAALLYLCAVFVWTYYYQEQRSGAVKKPLIMTARAKRIYRVALFWSLVSYFLIEALAGTIVPLFLPLLVLLVQVQPLVLSFANLILVPYEQLIQNQLIQEAKAKLSPMQVFVIAITGSFGKTSLKHILGHILGSLDDAYMTPKSVNTEMGITRAIREGLKEEAKLFIVEMGAYQRGSIARLCALVPPDLSIVTTIGPAHYERFRSLDEVARAKSEIVAAAMAQGGTSYLGPGVASYEAFSKLKEQYGEKKVFEEVLAKRVELLKAEHRLEGLLIEARIDQHDVVVELPIFGLHQVDNILLALLVVHDLGYDLNSAAQSLRSMEQITHRLEVRHLASGLTWVDDGFNSNPVGFRHALTFLTKLRDLKQERYEFEQKGRRVLITPGMTELGARHEEDHAQIGQFARDHVDILLVVQPERIESMVEAYQGGGGIVHRFTSFQKACHFFLKEQRAADVVLVENDLPDLYEDPPQF